jgi:hypothetical protein
MPQPLRVDVDQQRIEESERIFHRDLLVDHAELWEALERKGWIALEGGGVHLRGDGVFHTPLVQTLLARDAIGR